MVAEGNPAFIVGRYLDDELKDEIQVFKDKCTISAKLKPVGCRYLFGCFGVGFPVGDLSEDFTVCELVMTIRINRPRNSYSISSQ